MVSYKLPHNHDNNAEQRKVLIGQPNLLEVIQADYFQKFIDKAKFRVVDKGPGKAYRHTADNAGKKKHSLKEMASLIFWNNIFPKNRARGRWAIREPITIKILFFKAPIKVLS